MPAPLPPVPVEDWQAHQQDAYETLTKDHGAQIDQLAQDQTSLDAETAQHAADQQAAADAAWATRTQQDSQRIDGLIQQQGTLAARQDQAYQQTTDRHGAELDGLIQRQQSLATSPNPAWEQRTATDGATIDALIARQQGGPSSASGTPGQLDQSSRPDPSGLRAYARQAAARAGIDPAMFERQIDQESHFDPNAASGAGARGIAQIVPEYHPGVDPSDPRASLDYAANWMGQLTRQYGGDQRKALVHYNGGGGAVAAYEAGQPYQESQQYLDAIDTGQRPPVDTATASLMKTGQDTSAGAGSGRVEALGQFEQGLPTEDAYSICGPVAALAFAQANGRNPDLGEARRLAKMTGWTLTGGMNGVQNEQALLTQMGVTSRLDTNPDFGHIAQDAATGNPVIISTPVHYYFVNGYDKNTGQLRVMKTGTSRRGGGSWMSAEQIATLDGGINGALFVDNPQSPSPSVGAADTSGDTTGDRPPSEFAPPPDPGTGTDLGPLGGPGGSQPRAGLPDPLEQSVQEGGFLRPGGEVPYQQAPPGSGPGFPSAGDVVGGALTTMTRPAQVVRAGGVPVPPTTPLDTLTDQATAVMPFGPVVRGLERIGTGFAAQQAQTPEAGIASNLGTAMDKSQAGYQAMQRDIAANDPTGGVAAGAINTATGFASDPLVLAGGVGGLGGRVGAATTVGGGVAGGVVSQATAPVQAPGETDAAYVGRLREHVAASIESGAGIGNLAGVPAHLLMEIPAVRRVIAGGGRAALDLLEGGARSLAEAGPVDARLGLVPPGVARRQPGPVAIPTDATFAASVARTPGADLTPEGLVIDLERWQKGGQGGEQVAGGGTYYTAAGATDGGAHYRRAADSPTGGPEAVTGPTILRRPILAEGATVGGGAMEKAYTTVAGPDAWDALMTDAVALSNEWDALAPARRRSAVEGLLVAHGGDAADAPAILAAAERHGYVSEEHLSQSAAASVLRRAGYDSVVGFNGVGGGMGGKQLSEIIDLRESHYPTPAGGYTLRPEFAPTEPATTPRSDAALGFASDTAPPATNPASSQMLARGLGAVAGAGVSQVGTDETTPWQERVVRGVIGAEAGTRAGAHLAGAVGASERLGVASGGGERGSSTDPLAGADSLTWKRVPASAGGTGDQFTVTGLKAGQPVFSHAVSAGDLPGVLGEATAARITEAAGTHGTITDLGAAAGSGGGASPPGPRPVTAVDLSADPVLAKFRDMYAPKPVVSASSAGVGEKLRAIGTSLTRRWTDQGVDLSQFQHRVAAAVGPLPPEMMANEMARLTSEPGVTNMVKREMRDVLAADPLTSGHVRTYLTAQGNVDVAAVKGQARDFSGATTAAESQQALDRLKAGLGPDGFAEIKRLGQQVVAMNDWALAEKVRSGVLTQAAADEMRATYPTYTPVKVLDYLRDNATGITNSPGRSLSVRSTGIKTLSEPGTTAAREDPIASTLRNVYETQAMVRRNDAANGLIQQIEAAKQAGIPGVAGIEEVENGTTATRDQQPVVLFTAGEKRTFLLPKDMAAVVTQQGSSPNIFAPVMSLFKALHTGMSPAFLVRNIMIDAPESILRTASREGGPQYIPSIAVDLARSYMQAFQGIMTGEYTGQAARYLESGGGFGYFRSSEKAVAERLAGLHRTNPLAITDLASLKRVAWNLSFGPIEAVGQRLEMGPRSMAFGRAERRGLAPAQAVREGQTVTLDFNQGGSAAKVINGFIPFFNVGMQSAAVIPRAVTENPRGALLTFAGALAAPTLVAEAWNRADRRRAQDYANVPDYVKDGAVVVMLPGAAPVDARGERRPQYVQIPLRSYAPLLMLTRELASRAVGDDTRKWSDILLSAIQAVSPVQGISSLEPPVLGTGLQLASDYSQFRGAPIVSAAADDRASSLSHVAAAAVNAVAAKLGAYPDVHPSQVEFGARDIGGGVAAIPMAVSDTVVPRARITPLKGGTPQDIPVLGGALGNVVGGQTGQLVERAQQSALTPSAQKALYRAGLKSSVPFVKGEIDGAPLTTTEHAAYQRLANSYVSIAILEAASDPDWIGGTLAEKQAVLSTALAEAHAQATSEMTDRIGEDVLATRAEKRQLQQQATANAVRAGQTR